jgi:hypothetical protein
MSSVATTHRPAHHRRGPYLSHGRLKRSSELHK